MPRTLQGKGRTKICHTQAELPFSPSFGILARMNETVSFIAHATRRLGWLVALVWPLAALAADSAEPGVLERTFRQDDVALEVTVRPDAVSDLDDVDISLVLTHPDALDVQLPASFDDRLEGLRLVDSFEDAPVVADGVRRRECRLHARPVPGAERLRIAPFAVRWDDPSGKTHWFPTQGMSIGRRPLLRPDETPPEGIEENLRPVRIRRSPRAILRAVAKVLLALAALAALVVLFIAVRRRLRIVRMAPRERALHDLQALLGRRLAEQGRFKEFYIELTRIVRRYIERRHGIRAPRQTTEEFLQAAVSAGQFSKPTIERLSAFLASADLVKFAGVAATESSARASADSARAYLEAEPPSAADRRTGSQTGS